MSCLTTVLVGGPRVGKTDRLLRDYRETLAGPQAGTALFLAPTQRSVVVLRERLLAAGLRGCLSPNLFTFDQFASRVLAHSPELLRPLSPTLMRQLIQHVVQQAQRAEELAYFAPIAATRGFLDLVVGFVQEMKRLEIWPQEFSAALGPQASDKDCELAGLYSRYQDLLTQHSLYDNQGRFWAARQSLRDRPPRAYQTIAHVFVDGFTDFTRTEHEILEILASRAQTLTISLPLETDSRRPVLFLKPAKTLAELKRRHANVVESRLPARRASWPALAHVARELFCNPRQRTNAPTTAGIRIVAAAGVTGEIELLASQIKQLLVHGDADGPVPPGDVLVVFRSLNEVSQRLQEVFTEFGIPLAIESRHSLGRAPILQSIAAWLRLDLGDWPFRGLLAALNHHGLRPAQPWWLPTASAAAAERLVRHLQIPSGREYLLAQVARLAAKPIQPASDSKPRPIEQSARAALPVFTWLAEVFDRLPQRATLGGWSQALDRLVKELGFLPDDSKQADDTDRACWQQWQACCQGGERLQSWLGQGDRLFTRGEFFEHFQESLRSEPLAEAHDETGKVRVVGAESARNLSAPHVFLAGLSEHAFPPSFREDCLLSQAEKDHLITRGLPLTTDAERTSHEMLLFYEVLTRATKRLTLSYSAIDAAAQPLSPSPFLLELEQTCGATPIERQVQQELSGIPTADEVFSPRDLRVRAVGQALENQRDMLADWKQSQDGRGAETLLLAGLKVSATRRRGSGFGPFEGMLCSPDAKGTLAEQFGPNRIWSASQLEQYASCPFQFLLQRILHLSPTDEPVLETDYAGRGRMLHWLMATLHRDLDAADPGTQVSHQKTEKLLGAIEGLLAQLLAGGESQQSVAHGLRAIDSRRVRGWLAQYPAQHAKYDAISADWDEPLRPAHFEVSFGPKHGEPGEVDELDPETNDPLSSLEPFALECDGETIRFAGRIDRIDLGRIAGQTAFTILDYKTAASRNVSKAVRETALQLPLYALAAQQLLAASQAVPVHGAYWHVVDKGHVQAHVFSALRDGQLQANPDWESQQRELRARIAALVAGIRQGQFPMHSLDDKCTSRCGYHTVCRVHQIRSLEKAWRPPSPEPAP